MCSISFTSQKDNSPLSLGVGYIVKVIARTDAGSTVVTRDDAPNYDVNEDLDHAISGAGGRLAQVTVGGRSWAINKDYIRRYYPHPDGGTSIVWDVEQDIHAAEDYATLSPILGECGGDPGPIHGNVLYVSLTGNNDDAERGNPHKPWRTPWDAKNSTQFVPGDTVVVFPGQYEAAATGTVGDFINSNRELLTLSKSDINYYLYPGATLRYINGNSRAVFTDRTALGFTDTKIFGKGRIICDGDIRVIDHRDGGAGRLHIELDRIDVNCIGVSSAFTLDELAYLHWEVREVVYLNGATSPWIGTPSISSWYQYIKCDTISMPGCTTVTGDFGQSGSTYNSCVRIEEIGTWDVNMLTNYFYDCRNATWNDSYIKFKVDRLNVTSSAGTYEEWWRGGGGTTVFNNSQLHIEVGNFNGIEAFWRDVSGGINCVGLNSEVYFKGRYVSTGSDEGTINSLFEFDNSFYRLRFDAEVVMGSDLEFMRLLSAVPNMKISGRYHREGADTLVNFLSPSVNTPMFHNCIMSNSTGGAIMTSAGAYTVDSAGLYLSNATALPNITVNKFTEP